MARVAIVTGSNRGIGYATVKLLSKQFEGIIYITARNEKAGTEAVEKAKKEVEPSKAGLIRYHQLEITDKNSVLKLRDDIKKEHGGIDILINNAGILIWGGEDCPPFSEQATRTLGVNYFGSKQVCDILLPILKPHARVVNLASRLGHLGNFGAELKAKITSPTLTVAELDAMMNEFIELAQEKKHVDAGYPNSCYGVSKAGEIALTRIYAKQLSTDSRKDLKINSCCPGYVDTEMTKHHGVISVEEGADTPVFLALIPKDASGPNGEFCHERKVLDWNTYVFDPSMYN